MSVYQDIPHGLGVSLHHLPALYMLDFHMVVLGVVAASALVTLLVLWPAMRKATTTVCIVVTCLFPGFLAAYSLMLPDWMSSTAELSTAPLGYHDWMASSPLSRRLYSRTVGLHVGLEGANVTLLAVPTEGPEEECAPTPRPRKTNARRKGCFPELNLKDCPRQPNNALASPTLLAIQHSRAERMSRMFRGDGSSVVAATARRLLWHEWNEELEESYRSSAARRSKPVHFAARASPGANASLPVRMTKAPPGKTTATPTPATTRKTTLATGRRLGPCDALEGPAMTPLQPAWFDERIDFLYGLGPGLTFPTLLVRGAPSPILTVAEYLSRSWDYGSGGGEGEGWSAGSYDWGGRLRKAGHWSSCLLTTALVLWAFSIPLQMAEPESGAKMLGVSGLFMLAAAPAYAALLAYPHEHIRVEGVPLPLHWGGCFYCSVVAGAWATIAGFGLAVLRHAFPGAFTTDLDLEEVKQRTAKVRPVVVPESEGPRSMLLFT